MSCIPWSKLSSRLLVIAIACHGIAASSPLEDETSAGLRPIPNVQPEALSADDNNSNGKLAAAATTTIPRLECGIWLAPSTIPGSGLGMYAGRDFAKHEFMQDFGDVVIPIVDVDQHGGEYSDAKWKFLWDEYTWSADALHMDNEGTFSVNVASPGFGSAANSFLAIHNVEEHTPLYDAAGLHRSKDPGAGAFSPYCNRKSSARRNIKAGQELFVSYGSNWFETRKYLGPVPLFKELDKATELAEEYHDLHTDSNVPMDVLEDAWDTFVRNCLWKESRILGSFNHADKDEINKLKDMTLRQLRIQQSTQSLEWLEQFGTCGDHLVAGPSTIRQAGHGAFAARFLPAGTVVSHLPLIHVSDRGRLTMYNFGVNKKKKRKHRPVREKGVSGYQLLLNYCFGHAESTLLLCPYGPITNYVNHNSSLANVELRWADAARGNHIPALLNGSISDLETDATAKLAFEMVALRDILPGEEIFLDYGEAWEQAWQNHVATWKPVKDAEKYVPAWQLNEDTHTPLWTVFDQIKSSKYPKTVELRCDKTFLENDDWIPHYEKGDLASYLDDQGGSLIRCEVLRYRMKSGHLLYTVVMYEDDENDSTKLINHLVEDIPRMAFKFVDKPYTSDIFVPNAFRHDIRIPDAIFPEAWRNLKVEEQTS